MGQTIDAAGNANFSESWHFCQFMFPTPYPDVNAILARLLHEVQTILGDSFLGMYLYGSLAAGDFDPQHSDIDFVVVTTAELPQETFRALQAMHERIVATDSKWGLELEGSYIPAQALRRYDTADSTHPRLNRGEGLVLEQHHSDWIIQRHVLREDGVTLAGPTPRSLIDPITEDELRQAVLDMLWWWELQLEDHSLLDQSGYQRYAILSMCRILYTLGHGTIVSKLVAVRWAIGVLDQRWVLLIDNAFTWQPDLPLDQLPETLAFIRFTLDRCQQFELR